MSSVYAVDARAVDQYGSGSSHADWTVADDNACVGLASCRHLSHSIASWREWVSALALRIVELLDLGSRGYYLGRRWWLLKTRSVPTMTLRAAAPLAALLLAALLLVAPPCRFFAALRLFAIQGASRGKRGLQTP